MFIKDGGLRKGTEVEEKVRTAKGPAAEDRGRGWAGSRKKVTVRQGHTGREVGRKSLRDKRFFLCHPRARTVG